MARYGSPVEFRGHAIPEPTMTIETNADKVDPLPGQLLLPGVEPEIPATRSRALVGAWRKGRAAAIAGKTLADCPYPDRRCGPFGRVVTFSRAFRKWWRDGFESVGVFSSRGDGS
jgi:hypothetical protein